MKKIASLEITDHLTQIYSILDQLDSEEAYLKEIRVLLDKIFSIAFNEAYPITPID